MVLLVTVQSIARKPIDTEANAIGASVKASIVDPPRLTVVESIGI